MKLQNLPHCMYLPVVLQFKRRALHRLGKSLGCLPSPTLVKKNKPKEVRQLNLGLTEIVSNPITLRCLRRAQEDARQKSRTE